MALYAFRGRAKIALIQQENQSGIVRESQFGNREFDQ